MEIKNPRIKKILKYYRTIWALSHLYNLGEWDSEVYLPKNSSSDRGVAMSEVAKLKQKLFLNKRFREMIKESEKEELNDIEQGIIRVLRKDLDYYEKVPKEIIEEFEKTRVEANNIWIEAKQKSDFNIFRPYLEKLVDLNKKISEYLGYEKHPYDALLDMYEEGLTTDDVERIFSVLNEIKKIFWKVYEKKIFPDSHKLESEEYNEESMKRLNKEVLKILGYDFNRGRLDLSAHPFTIGLGLNDVRITTWYHKNDFRRSLLATIHEFGHALYELQIDPKLAYTPVASGASLGIHESQSRFWENHVGRSLEFVESFLELFREYLPFLKNYDAIEVYKYFNIVRPELIRVEADELSYHFHIYIRYQIEKLLMENSLEVAELPEYWNEKIEEYLKRRPRNDSEGVLQDVHWSLGMIGYFPTYSLGSFLAAQLYYKMQEEINLKEKILEGNFEKIRLWLKEKIHKYGAIYPPKDLIKKVLNEEYNAEYFLKYVKAKYSEIF